MRTQRSGPVGLRFWGLSLLTLLLVSACGKNPPPLDRPTPPPPPAPLTDDDLRGFEDAPPARRPDPPPLPVPPEPVLEDSIASKSLDDLNREAVLQPAFFAFDSASLDEASRGVLDQNAGLLRTYATWVVTIEGHCDERGTAEYNLALGERRASAARDYLVSLGISSNRLRIVTYGKEFPFDPGHDEAAWARNRRAHFVITSR